MKTPMEKMEWMAQKAIIAAISVGIIGGSFSATARVLPGKGQQQSNGNGQQQSGAKTQTSAGASAGGSVQGSVSVSGSAGIVNFTEAGVNLVNIGQTGDLASG